MFADLLLKNVQGLIEEENVKMEPENPKGPSN